MSLKHMRASGETGKTNMCRDPTRWWGIRCDVKDNMANSADCKKFCRRMS